MRLRRVAACAAAVIALASGMSPAGSRVGAQGWNALFDSRLASSSALLEARLALKSAELDMARHLEPWRPTVALNASAQSPLSFGSAGFSSGSLVPSLALENLAGADLVLKAPVVASSGGLALGDPSVSLSRKIFTEGAADRLDAEAAVMGARAAVWNAESAVRLALATEVLSANYYGILLEANQANLAVLERVRSSTVDTFSLREVERRVLGARKSILAASSALAGIAPEVLADLDALYGDVLRMQESWSAQADAAVPVTPSILALELSLAAAEKRQAFAILPWLPNPSLGASLAYDMSDGSIDWGLSLSMSYTLLDPGRTALNALRRETMPRVYAIRLEDARKSLSENVRRIRNNLATLDLDRRIKEFDIADAEEEFRTYEALFQGGYITEETKVIAQIDLSIERLAARKIEHDILIQTLSLAQYCQAQGHQAP